MLQAMNTGHEGSLSTIHANSPRDALSRLETMVLMSGFDLPVRAIREQTSSALDLLVHLARLGTARGASCQISEVEGMEGDTIVLQDIFYFDYSMGIDETAFLGRLKSTGLPPDVRREARGPRHQGARRNRSPTSPRRGGDAGARHRTSLALRSCLIAALCLARVWPTRREVVLQTDDLGVSRRDDAVLPADRDPREGQCRVHGHRERLEPVDARARLGCEHRNPIDVVLLIDTSGSMKGDRSVTQRRLRQLRRGDGAQGPGRDRRFAPSPVGVDFTANRARLYAVIEASRLRGRDGALRRPSAAAHVPGERRDATSSLLSDGGDTVSSMRSTTPWRSVDRRARRSTRWRCSPRRTTRRALGRSRADRRAPGAARLGALFGSIRASREEIRNAYSHLYSVKP